MVIDVLVALAVAVAVVIGFYRGIIQPLLSETFFVATLALIFRNRQGFAELTGRLLHANAVISIFLALVLALAMGFVGARLGGLIHRMPAVRGVDGFLGVFAHGFVALVFCYLLLSALVVLDKAFAPTLNNASLSAAQVAAIKRQLASSPLTAGLANNSDLARLQAAAARPGGAKISETPQLNQLQTVYEDFLQPQLRSSHLAPVVLGIGQHLPLIGRVGPKDLPRATTSPSPSPSPRPLPSPSPTRRP